MTVALVRARDARRENGRPAESVRRVRRFCCGDASVAVARIGSDDPRTHRTNNGVHVRHGAPGESRREGNGGHIAFERGPDTDGHPQESAFAQSANGIREGNWKRSSGELQVRDCEVATEAGANRDHLTVQRAADDRYPV